MPMSVERLGVILRNYERVNNQATDTLAIALVKSLHQQLQHSLFLTREQEWTLFNCFASGPNGLNPANIFVYLSCLQDMLGSPLNREPWHVIRVLQCMKTGSFYNKRYFEAIKNHRESRNLLSALLKLNQHGIFSERNFLLVHRAFNATEMARALCELAAEGILTRDNCRALKHHRYPLGLVVIFKMLHEQQLLLPGNRAWVVRQSDPWSTALVLRFFRASGILTQENLQHLCAPRHAWLLSPQAHTIIWDQVPEEVFDELIFQELLAYTAFENPLVPLARDMARFLDVIARRAVQLPPAAILPVAVFNDGDSTHVASVHKTASESALRLFQRYETQWREADIQQRLDAAMGLVVAMTGSKNQAALRGIQRITQASEAYQDPTSKITLRLLIALVWSALHDASVRLGSLDSARQLFLEALYEIQRGNNLSEYGIDNQQREDDVICPAGAFNKLIEKLQGIHPDCTIHYLNTATAALKLPIVVRATLMPCLFALAQPLAAVGALSFTRLIQHLTTEGMAILWGGLVKPIAKEMFEEFHSLYKGVNDPLFKAFIAVGQDDCELGDLRHFQRPLQQSWGYHAYCQQQLVENHELDRSNGLIECRRK